MRAPEDWRGVSVAPLAPGGGRVGAGIADVPSPRHLRGRGGGSARSPPEGPDEAPPFGSERGGEDPDPDGVGVLHTESPKEDGRLGNSQDDVVKRDRRPQETVTCPPPGARPELSYFDQKMTLGERSDGRGG
ncbi:hypothetical protein THAOC_27724, partial [Thalassiosira oceanica]